MQYIRPLQDPYLGESDDHPEDDQRLRSVGPRHERRDDRADAAEQHSQTQRGFAAVFVGEHSAGHLRDHVTPKERAQHQPLGFLVPVEFHNLKRIKRNSIIIYIMTILMR